jgi:alkanesulfonate monooxygenase SsuD/methylene tetrahydromethanopterin reductase-like flavin-dependent oxidoreductase (luciferase family)
VIGSSDQVIDKLRELESIGVDEWIVYLMTHDQEETLEAYGRDVIPALASS